MGLDEAGAAPRVLVVDDEPVIRLVLGELFDEWSVHSAGTASEALARLDEIGDVDVALVDKNLPDRSGLELIGDIKQRCPTAEVIVITGFPSMDAAFEAIRMGASDFVSKPFDTELLAIKVRNASEKSRLRVALHDSEERHREVFEASPDAILMIDAETRTVAEANPAASRLYGYARDELLGKAAAALVATAPEQAPRVQFEDGHMRAVDRRDLKRDGTVFPTEVSTAFASLAGRPMVLEIVRDLSERTRARDEQKKLQEELAQTRKVEALGQLAGGIAHDFNNVLVAFQSYAQFLREFLEEHPEVSGVEGALEDVAAIEEAATSAANLTRQLLAFSRRQIVMPEVLSLNDVVTQMNKMMRRLMDESIVLETSLAEELSPVKMDRGQVEQVLMNLLLNARDAMPQGGSITLDTANVRGDRGSDWVQLRVRDTGVGMLPEVASQVFEPFFTTKREGCGTGLGLATVQSIVAQANGEVSISSAPGAGSSFCVRLPCVRGRPSQPVRSPASLVPPGRGERVLVVDDDAGVLESVRRLLAKGGYAVTQARSAKEALELADASPAFDVLLTDVVMPGMSGRKLAELMARRFPALKVLCMSGYAAEAVIERGLLFEGMPFLAKPFSEGRLLATIRNVLDESPPG